jgi:hypothetical protein
MGKQFFCQETKESNHNAFKILQYLKDNCLPDGKTNFLSGNLFSLQTADFLSGNQRKRSQCLQARCFSVGKPKKAFAMPPRQLLS